MAKKTKVPDGQLADWQEEVPEAVQDAVDEYVKSLRIKNKATEKLNSRKEVVIETMKEHDVDHVRIDEGKKVLMLSEMDILKIEKAKEPETAGGDETVLEKD